MKKSDVQKLDHGLYKIFWKDSQGGGSSLAAVGSLHSGRRWMAPTNWTSQDNSPTVIGHRHSWYAVERVELIKSEK